MPSKVDNPISRSVMFLCLGTAAVLVFVQWGNVTMLLPTRYSGIVRGDRKRATVQPVSTQKSAALASSTTTPKTNVRLVVDLSDRQVSLYKGDKLQSSFSLAVAQAGWETPTGNFQVIAKEKNPTFVHPITAEEILPGADNPLGVAWIGFWTDGESEIGFHGTNQEELIGEAVSHGCLRMRNADIETVYAQVEQGTPVIVQP